MWRLTHERLTAERDRIRDARQFFARQLGPLPTVAGVSIGLVAAFSERIEHEWVLWIALLVFGLMVAASVLYGGMPAYRELRARRLEKGWGQGEGISTSRADWYRAEAKLEADIYGTPRKRRFSLAPGELWWSRPRRDLEGSLQDQLDRERFGVFVVQVLFLAVIALLVLAR